MQFGINHWGSHPDKGNDDRYSGSDFDTYEEAYKAFWTEPKDHSVAYIEMVRYVGEHMVESVMIRNNPMYLPEREDDWHREQAMEAGMAFGIDAYNERMGYV